MKAALFAAFAALVGRVHAAGLSMADYAHPEHVQLEQAPREFCSVLASVKPLRNADQRADQRAPEAALADTSPR